MMAHDRVVTGRKNLLIVIQKENININRLPPDLRPYISKSEYFTLSEKGSLGCNVYQIFRTALEKKNKSGPCGTSEMYHIF